MQISVVIPTHNRGHTLARALDSVLAQSYPAAEILVVDDGSEDGTQVMLAQRYPEVHWICQPNKGVSSARNAGIAQAGCDWVALLDSDDAWHRDRLRLQVEALEAQPCHELCHSDEIWIRRGQRVNPMRKHAKSGGWIYRQCLPRCVISPSAVLLRRSLLLEVGGFDETLPACEDYDLWLRICAHQPVLYLPHPLVIKYGGHDDQLSRRFWGMDRFRVRALERILAGGSLSPMDELATLETLIGKLEILVAGARKRANQAIWRHYQSKWLAYRQLYTDLTQLSSHMQ